MPSRNPTDLAGFRMTAEWEPHAATWLAWPHNRRDWPGRFAPIHWVYVEIVRHLHRRERVELIVESERAGQRARKMLEQAGVDLSQVGIHCFPTDRSWLRDSGPIFVTNGSKLAATHWGFTAWAKYSNWRKDASVGRKIAEAAKVRVVEPAIAGRRVVLEGGAIDVNGCGTLMTTEQCLLGAEQQRNAGVSREWWEDVFARFLGIRKVLWLGQGIAGDDTHGHIDDLARFVGPRTVATIVEADRNDVNYQPLQANLKRLRSMTGQDGRPLEIIELPTPRPLIFKDNRMPASYANFYIANGLVLVPTFNDPSDRIALDRLANAFPGREVVGIHCSDLVWGFGTLHCSTQQQPAIPRS